MLTKGPVNKRLSKHYCPTCFHVCFQVVLGVKIDISFLTLKMTTTRPAKGRWANLVNCVPLQQWTGQLVLADALT